MRRQTYALLLAVALCSSCQPTSGNNGSSDDADASDAAQSDGYQVPPDDISPNGPQFDEVSIETDELTDTGAITVSTVMSHPEGLDEIVGGALVTVGQAETRDYVSFTSSSEQEDKYLAYLSWDYVTQYQTLTFAKEQRITVGIEFVDIDGNASTKYFAVRLHCDGFPACENECEMTPCTEDCADSQLGCTLGECTTMSRVRSAGYCGTCGLNCGPDSRCEDATCICGANSTLCGDRCTFLGTDADNCGECGNVCEEGTNCSGGECIPFENDFAACERDDECPFGPCRTTNGVCFVRCEDSEDCPAGSACSTNFCVESCETDDDCTVASFEECVDLQERLGDSSKPEGTYCY